MRFGSVCSGIEAASVASRPLGWQAAWLSEIEPFPSAVLAHHYPDVPNLGDMLAIPALVRAQQIEAPDVFVGGTPCFTAGHGVLTDRGYVPIEEIRIGDFVVTHKGRLCRVLRTGFKLASVGQLKATGISSGISCTPSHPFLSADWSSRSARVNGKAVRVESLSGLAWVPAEDMPGKQWCSLTKFSIAEPEMPSCVSKKELMYIAGFYLGDGFIRRYKGKNKKAIIFGVNENKLTRFKNKVGKSICVTYERTGPRIALGSTEIADWLIRHFGERSHAKTIPAWVMSSEYREDLLCGYLDTDGCIQSSGWKASSVSRSLAYGLRDLAQSLGMIASIGFVKKQKKTVIENRVVNQRDYWSVVAYDADKSRKSRMLDDLLLRSVRSFDLTGVDTVFNIEVEDDNSYVLDGAIVHNCQAFSVAGKRESLTDDRGQLSLTFCEIADAIDDIRRDRGEPASIIFWENVPGVLNTADNAFGCFLGALAGEDGELQPAGKKWTNAGCVFGPKRAVAWRVLDAQYFGLAQRRKRVFVVASARDGFDPAKVLFEFDGVRRDTTPRREAGQEVAGTLASRTGAGGFPGADESLSGYVQPVFVSNAEGSVGLPFLTCSNIGKTVNNQTPLIVPAYGIPGNWIGRAPENGGNAVEPMHDVAPRLTSTDRHGVAYAVHGTKTHALTAEGFTGEKVERDFCYADAEKAGPAGGKGQSAFITSQVRRLTVEECEFLQGFPRSYTQIPWRKKPASECPDGPRYKALGNSWAVNCVQWIFERIDRHVRGEL